MKKLLIFSLILMLAGCYSVGRKIDQSAVDKIEKGKTSKDQVVSMLGSPDQITRLGNGDLVFNYTYVRATAKPQSFIPCIGPFVGGANTQHQMFSVTFGSNNIVNNFMSTQGALESGSNLEAGEKPDLPDLEKEKRPK